MTPGESGPQLTPCKMALRELDRAIHFKKSPNCDFFVAEIKGSQSMPKVTQSKVPSAFADIVPRQEKL